VSNGCVKRNAITVSPSDREVKIDVCFLSVFACYLLIRSVIGDKMIMI